MTTDTKAVTGRRQLRFNNLDDILADVNWLAQAKKVLPLGNWTPGQVLRHLTIVMNGSIDGTTQIVPGFVQFFLRLVYKGKFLTQPMEAGFQLPAKGASLLPGPISWEEGLAGIRLALKRLQTDTKREPHPAIGTLTVDEWNQLHCRHAELHLSFLMPAPERATLLVDESLRTIGSPEEEA